MDVDPISHQAQPTVDVNALQDYLHAMQTQFTQQLQRLEQQQQQLASNVGVMSHRVNPSPSPPPPPPAHSPSGRHTSHSGFHRSETESISQALTKLLHRPSQFHGEHGHRVYDWLAELDHTFENLDPHGAMTEKQKITFARQCLLDEALRWWIAREHDVKLSQQRLLLEQSGAVTPHFHPVREITTWSEFKQAMIEYFCPRGASEAARNQLHSLQQSQFRDLASYCDRFETIARRITTVPGQDITEELLATFKNGLSNGQIRLHLTTNHPSSLFEATRLAMQAESDLRLANYGVPNKHPRSFRHGATHFRKSFHRSSNEWQRPSSYSRPPSSEYSTQSTWTSTNRGGEDTSAPMELGVIKDHDDSVRSDSEIASPMGSDHSSPNPTNDEDRSEDIKSDRDTASPTDEINFVSRQRRPSDRPSFFRPVSKSQSSKQQFLKRYDCYNCGKPGHFLINCPFKKEREGSSSPSKSGLSKKF
jgi:hypothetical protein